MNLLEAVKKCSPFIAKSKDCRVAMTHVAYDRGVCIATDGRIMAVATTPAENLRLPVRTLVAGTEDELPGFPNWERALVEDTKLIAHVECDKDEVVAALEFLIKAWKVAEKANRASKSDPFVTHVRAENGKIVLVLQATGTRVEMKASHEHVDGLEFPLHAYNAEYLLKAAKACEGVVKIRVQDGEGSRASIVCGANDDFKVVLMPVRLRD